MYPLPESRPLPPSEQPVESIEVVAGLYFRSILLEEAGHVVPQHVHDHDHATMIAAGAARLWVNGIWQRDYQAGQAASIEAGQTHLFQSLAPKTRLVCIHDVASADSIRTKGL